MSFFSPSLPSLSLCLVCSKSTFFPPTTLVWNFSPRLGMEAYTYTFLFHRFPWFLDVVFHWWFPSLFLTSSPPTPEHSCPHPELEGWAGTTPSMRDRNRLTLCAAPPSPALHSLMVCFSSLCQESSIPPHQPRWETGLSWTCEGPGSCFGARLPSRCSEQGGKIRALKFFASCPPLPCPHPIPSQVP